MMGMPCCLCQLQLCTSARQHLSQNKPNARITAPSLATWDVWGRQRRYATEKQYCELSRLRAGHLLRAPPRPFSQELFVFPTSAVCYGVVALLRSIWTFYGDVIYVASWHVNDARNPCLPSIFMNNCVRGSGRDGGVWWGEGLPHVHQKSPEHGAWVVELRGPRFTCLQALAHLFIQTHRIPREKISGKRTKKQTGMFDVQLSNFSSTLMLQDSKSYRATTVVDIYLLKRRYSEVSKVFILVG